jgi:hypothetical protein
MDQTSKDFCRCFEEVVRNYGFNGNLGKDFDSQAFHLAESYKSINNS